MPPLTIIITTFAGVVPLCTGAATKGGDPDPTGDESHITISTDYINFPKSLDGGAGGFQIGDALQSQSTEKQQHLQFSSLDGDLIDLKLGPDDELIVDFGGNAPATIVYGRAPTISNWSTVQAAVGLTGATVTPLSPAWKEAVEGVGLAMSIRAKRFYSAVRCAF
jgi:hypothetical protein